MQDFIVVEGCTIHLIKHRTQNMKSMFHMILNEFCFNRSL